MSLLAGKTEEAGSEQNAISESGVNRTQSLKAE